METITLEERTQRVTEQLETIWQSLQQIAPPRQVTGISRFIDSLPDPYQSRARNWIAKYMVSTMGLHILSLMAAFQEHAVEEGILPKHCAETFEEILPPTFEYFEKITQNLAVRSLDDLVLLGYATKSLEGLSRPGPAALMQDWLYDVAEMYHDNLRDIHLLAKGDVSSPLANGSGEAVVPISLDSKEKPHQGNGMNGTQNGSYGIQAPGDHLNGTPPGSPVLNLVS